MTDHKKSAGKFVLAGLLGAVAGAIGGLLFAPQSGKETREDIAELANKITKQVKTGVTDTKDRVKEVFGNASQEAMEKYKEVRGKIVDKVAALKTVGNEINKEKYGEIVEKSIEEKTQEKFNKGIKRNVLEGDSGPYLQYTYTRCASVLRKTKIREQKNIENIPEHLNEEESALIKDFYKFEEKIKEAANRYSPSIIAEYLLNIAQKYNEFYAKNRILEQKEEDFRIFLTKTTSNILKTGLGLLGIKTVEKM